MSTANMEHVFEVASAVDVATLTSYACVGTNFSIPLGNILSETVAISWISIIIERTVGEEFGLNFSLEDLLNPNFWNRVWKFRIDICDNTVFEFLVWVFLSFLVVRLVRFKVWNFETVKIRYMIISVLRSTKDSNF